MPTQYVQPPSHFIGLGGNLMGVLMPRRMMCSDTRKLSYYYRPSPDGTRILFGGRDGTIEAVARTLVMGFREDIAIRITPLQTGAQIDVRSASRFGPHDFGSNASRVRGLLEEIDEAAGTPPEPRPEPARPQ